MELSLLIEENGTGHDNLVLRFAGQSLRCDTYYLALDGEGLPEEGVDNTGVVLQKLLEQWLSVVESVPDGGTAYLPYDFSDQYTAWLRCCRFGNMADICVGWAEVEGWSIAPSAIGQYVTLLSSFRPEKSNVRVPMSELIEAIRRLLE